MQNLDQFPDYEFDAKGWPHRVATSKMGRPTTTGKLEPSRIRESVPYFQLKNKNGTYQTISLSSIQRHLTPIPDAGVPIPNFSDYSFNTISKAVINRKTNRVLRPSKTNYVSLRNDQNETKLITVRTIEKLVDSATYALSDAACYVPACPEYRFDSTTQQIWRVSKNGVDLLSPIPLVPDGFGYFTLNAEEGSALAEIQCYERDELDEIVRVGVSADPVIITKLVNGVETNVEFEDSYFYRREAVVRKWAVNGKLRVRATEECIDRLIIALAYYPEIKIQ